MHERYGDNMTGIAEIIFLTFPDLNLANNKAYLTLV